MRFRVRTGGHIVGSRTYTRGQVLESDIDLVKRFGAARFERLRDRPPTGAAVSSPAPPVSEVRAPAPSQQEEDEASVPDQEEVADDEYGEEPDTSPEGTARIREQLHELSVRQLLQLAANEQIDLGGATRKDDVITAIMRAKGFDL